MKKNTDGSVTLSQEELEEINKAYQALYGIFSDGPSFIGDYFVSHDGYVNCMKWKHQLNGEKFDSSDYE
jgi:hypothetical protein